MPNGLPQNRIEKFLQSCGFRLSSFIPDIFGASGSAIIKHLYTHGSITIKDLDGYLKTQTRNKISEIMQAINGKLDKHQMVYRASIKLLLLPYLRKLAQV